MDRYARNMKMLSKEENENLRHARVCIIGCGGLGGYIIEFCGRLGIGHITAVDGDVFDVSNLNRQILSDESVLGKSKALIAKERMKIVNSDIHVNAISELFNESNGLDIIKGHHIVVDALDNLQSRKLLQKYCKELNIPLVHGAIGGWYGQVCTILPGDDTLNKIYPDEMDKGIEVELGNPSFTPALVASIEVGEVLKLLIERGDLIRNQLLILNLYNNEFETITF